MADAHVPDPQRRAEPEVSSVRLADHTGLPPAHLLAAEHNPLHDEDLAYTALLAAAGCRSPGRTRPWHTASSGSRGVVPAAQAARVRLAHDVAALFFAIAVRHGRPALSGGG